jgi:hypothetical protein
VLFGMLLTGRLLSRDSSRNYEEAWDKDDSVRNRRVQASIPESISKMFMWVCDLLPTVQMPTFSPCAKIVAICSSSI